MNADKFFETHSIEEISKKTKISPISLRLIRNREFEKIPRVKFIGFINILQKSYKVDLSDLIEEYNQFTPVNKPESETNEIKESKNPTLFLSIATFVLLILGGYLFYSYIKTNNSPQVNYTQSSITQDNNFTVSKNNKNIIASDTNTNTNNSKTSYIDKNENNISKTIITHNTKTSITTPTNMSDKNTSYKIEIIPNEKLWFRALNIDTNKSIEYLTSNPKTLPKGNYYIKFGHGNLTIIYNDQNITPDTKKIIRILFKDGNFTYMKKPNRYEK